MDVETRPCTCAFRKMNMANQKWNTSIIMFGSSRARDTVCCRRLLICERQEHCTRDGVCMHLGAIGEMSKSLRMVLAPVSPILIYFHVSILIVALKGAEVCTKSECYTVQVHTAAIQKLDSTGGPLKLSVSFTLYFC